MSLRRLAVFSALSALVLAGVPVAGQPGFAPAYAPAPAAPGYMGSPLEHVRQELAQHDERVGELEQRQRGLSIELEQLGERRATASRTLRRRARALYRIERAGMLPLGGGFEAMLSHLSRVERMRRIVRTDLHALRSLRQRAEVLRSDAERMREESEELAHTRAGLEQRARELEAQSRIQQQVAGIFDPRALPPLPVVPPSAVSALPTHPPAQYAPAPAPQYAPAPQAPIQGQIHRSDVPQPAVAARGFARERGQLPLPVAAGGDLRPGERDGAQVLEFQPPPGSSALAVADGRVAFAERYGSYGLLVILDHGGGYYTLYGGLQATSVASGEWVGRGARVGRIGRVLAFEVRQGTRSLDTRSWLGI